MTTTAASLRQDYRRLLGLSRHTVFTTARGRSKAHAYDQTLAWLSSMPDQPTVKAAISRALGRMRDFERAHCEYRNPDGLRCLNEKSAGSTCCLLHQPHP